MILLSGVLFSCESMLDVKPFDKLELDKVYATEKSTNNVLNGLYLRLADNNLYGRNLSCGMVEVLAQHYLTPYKHTYYELGMYAYNQPGAQSFLSSTWESSYKLIAECNEFLEQVTLRKENYATAKFNLYYGEALALRTWLHFDMFRLFGPVYATEPSAKSVPYYTFSSSVPQPILPASALLDSLTRDLDEAIRYLQHDPILEVGIDQDNETTDFFKSYRNCRINLYAAYALKARMCLYRGDETARNEAYRIASGLLENKHPGEAGKATNFSSAFSFIDPAVEPAEYVFFPEMIFTIINSRRDKLQKDNFSVDLDVQTLLAGGSRYFDFLYNATGTVGGRDDGPRAKIWEWSEYKQGELLLRYAQKQEDPSKPYHAQIQTMFRLGELYLIAAETAPDTETKAAWLEKLRINRGYRPGNVEGLSNAELNNLIEIEFIRETYGEGQYFFFAKRKNLKNLTNQDNVLVGMGRNTFVPPLPDSETNYRNSDDNGQNQ